MGFRRPGRIEQIGRHPSNDRVRQARSWRSSTSWRTTVESAGGQVVDGVGEIQQQRERERYDSAQSVLRCIHREL